MAENKTKATTKSFNSYVTAISDPVRREDCVALANLMCEVTGQEPTMWGASIVGFGSYHYKYESGREGDMCLTGFSSRKQDLTIYLSPGYAEDEPLLLDLGKHKTGLGCLYVKKLADIDLAILKQLVALTVQEMKQRHPGSSYALPHRTRASGRHTSPVYLPSVIVAPIAALSAAPCRALGSSIMGIAESLPDRFNRDNAPHLRLRTT